MHLSPELADAQRRALAVLQPPPVQRLSTWIEENVVLPGTVSANPGAVELYPYQVEIADSMSDPTVERISIVKGARLGFTTLLTSAVAAFVANDPCNIMVLQPTDSDARGYVVDDLEPVFSATPAVRNAMTADRGAGDAADRNTITSKKFAGGSLKVISARAPRNLRRHNVRVLLIDEADAMEVGAEGSPIALAEKRTMSYSDRRIVVGSTPIFTDTSHVLALYAQSDQRRYEVPCPSCGTFNFIEWQHIEWPHARPDLAFYRCPSCAAEIDERFKNGMVRKGAWIPQAPEVKAHRGYLMNALISPLSNASWGKLAVEFTEAKGDPSRLQPFVNTVLAQGWSNSADTVDETSPIGLDRLPEEVLVLTAGVDVQDDRLEISVLGWCADGTMAILGHHVLYGSPDDDLLWRELDELLATRWRHPFGCMLQIRASAIDSSDGDWTARIYAYAGPRAQRGVHAIKGQSGKRLPIVASGQKPRPGQARLWLIGVDGLKQTLLSRLERGRSIRLSDSLSEEYLSQLTSERRVLR